ncbi:hypothetical protein ABW19_dt0202032 [Dactylella cylindrospora]|nr:hypothetical protein ABW19_dt0202032 [Dactylella cylindrospora]
MFIQLDLRRPDPPTEVKLEVEFEKAPNTGKYRVCSSRWLRLTLAAKEVPDIMRKKVPLDIKMVNLETLVSYQIDLSIGQEVPDVEKYPLLSEFVRHLELEDSKDGQTKRVSYITLPNIAVKSIITKTKYPYWFAGTPYIFEIIKYDHIRGNDMIMRRQRITDGGFPTDYSFQSGMDVRWGASLYNSEWDLVFNKQAQLPIGCTSDWEPSLDSFLSFTPTKIDAAPGPKFSQKLDKINKDLDGKDGFSELMERIQQCIDIITEAKERIGKLEEIATDHDDLQSMLEYETGKSTVDSEAGRGRASGADWSRHNLASPVRDELDESEDDIYAPALLLGPRPTATQQPVKKDAKGERKNKARPAIREDESTYGDSEYSRVVKDKTGYAKATRSVADSDSSFA